MAGITDRAQTPLEDLLRAVPVDAQYESHPVGCLSHAAATELETFAEVTLDLVKENEHLRQRLKAATEWHKYPDEKPPKKGEYFVKVRVGPGQIITQIDSYEGGTVWFHFAGQIVAWFPIPQG